MDCNLKTTKLLYCALIGVCAVIRSNTLVQCEMFGLSQKYRKRYKNYWHIFLVVLVLSIHGKLIENYS